ncbi:hypothetical protein CON66_16740 [Bacillus cereus]|uniref:Uncharacterized protein n=1 Tax=Bacillus cereus (strain G9842) TaxID=405531 RepID=B7ITD1_BACC2|nr:MULTISPECIES: hypothetical protein [Bacillus cereus group]ACK94683.1 hypothetical protein BCG9842_B3309 [Bacillus cereus G9842]MDR4135386.1 hypothetical protein [Bacillus cereus]MDR4367570.1 hypothetical protein [Bacillus cereus]PDZ35689.1 hypothetical protein CON68_01965 [Bacillus toyonensis]PEA95324.1 hypothetical protein CON66_16740 [Bacillus cereus]
MENQSAYSPQEFLNLLKNKEFSDSNPSQDIQEGSRRPLKFTGLLNNIDSENQFMVTVGSTCDNTNWRKIPLDIIDQIVYLGTVDCEAQGEYTKVQITFKEPETEEATIFASLVLDILDNAERAVLNLLEMADFKEDKTRRYPNCVRCLRGCVGKGDGVFDCLADCGGKCP